MKFIKNFLPHLSIAMLLGMIVLVIMDNHNPMMKFLTSSASKVYIIIMCVIGIVCAVLYAAKLRRED